MKIKAINKNVKSMKLSVPIDGIIDIDANGVAEVSPNCGKMLIEGTNDWKEYSDGKGAEKDETGSEGDGDENNPTESDDDSEKKPTDEEVIEGLKKLSFDDCVNMANEAGYPKKEWEKLAKNEKSAETLMRKYLIKKYKDASKK